MPEISAGESLSYAKLANILEKSRREDELSLFIFGGGSLGPSPFSSLDRGSHIVDILNTLEPDLMSLGKREFSYFEDELTLRSYEAAFPFVSSNLYDPLTKGNLEGINTTLLIDKGEVRIGIIAILDEEVVEEYLLQRAEVREPRVLIDNQARELRQQGADIIMLIFSKERDYYPALLNADKIDLALQVGRTSETESNAISPQTSHMYAIPISESVLKLELTWPENSPQHLNISEVSLNLNKYTEDTTTALLIDEYNNRLHRLLDQKIGRIGNSFTTLRHSVRTEENPFGNFVADALKEATDADIALINGGIIRGNTRYQANENITRGNIVSELPFRSKLSLVSISGQQLLDALENGVSQAEFARGRFPQVSGIQITYSASQPPGQRIKTVLINGKELDVNQRYLLATSDYLVNGGDGYTALQEAQGSVNIKSTTNNIPLLLSEVVIQAIQSKQSISPELNSRIVRIEP